MKHNLANDIQYPPGQGVPQWKLVAPVPGTVAAELAAYHEIFKLA